MRTTRIYYHITILIVILCSSLKATCEPMYETLSRDSVNKILNLLLKTKPDTNQVKLFLSLVDFYLENNDDTCGFYTNKALSLSEHLNFKYGQAKALGILGELMYRKSDSIGSAKQFARAISISRLSGNKDLEALIWYRMGICRSSSAHTMLEELYYQKAMALYKSSGNKVNEAYLLKTIADFHFNRGKPLQSLKELFETLDIYKSAGYKKLHNTYDLIGAVYRSMGNYEEALSYAITALNLARTTKDTSDLSLFYSRIGSIYNELEQYDNAITYFKISLQQSKQAGNVNFIRGSAGLIAVNLAKLGRAEEGLSFYLAAIAPYPSTNNNFWKYTDGKFLGHLYLSLKKYAIAEKYYLQMFNVTTFTGTNSENYKRQGLVNIGKFYVAVNQFDRAKNYLLKALKMASTNSTVDLAQIHQLLFKVDSASSDYISAIRHYQIYKSINDSIFKEKKINQIASLQTKFETEKKDQDISLLTAKTKEQQETLKKQRSQRKVLISGSLMLLLLLWFIYSRYQFKNKTAKQLQAKQEIINNKNGKLEELLIDKEELLAAKNELITEKEWLLKEVHHRVKNNLQMIMTLLYTQSTYLKDEQALGAIIESQNRIHAISLIHQKLYQSDNLEVINMKGYIHELVDNLKESFDKENGIEVELNIEPIELDVSRSIPVGLVLNEAVTNAMKYAFDTSKKNTISICLNKQQNNDIILTVKDNGKGLSPGFQPSQSTTLGLNLINGLCKQIKAKCSIESNPGVCISIRFRNPVDTVGFLDEAVLENN